MKNKSQPPSPKLTPKSAIFTSQSLQSNRVICGWNLCVWDNLNEEFKLIYSEIVVEKNTGGKSQIPIFLVYQKIKHYIFATTAFIHKAEYPSVQLRWLSRSSRNKCFKIFLSFNEFKVLSIKGYILLSVDLKLHYHVQTAPQIKI